MSKNIPLLYSMFGLSGTGGEGDSYDVHPPPLVTCQVSHVTYLFFVSLFSLNKLVGIVGGGSVTNGA